MPHSQRHRGAHPEDGELFAPAPVETLQQAVEQAVYLLDHGYAASSVLDVVGRRHELRVRQRVALQRCICSSEQRRVRQSKLVPATAVRGKRLAIDGFNLIISLEVALSGGVLLRGHDRAIRDLAGLRGTYRPVTETHLALELLGRILCGLAPSALDIWLDQPVSNAGRLRGLIVDHAMAWVCPVSVIVAKNPDRELFKRECVVTSDSNILDHVTSWVNLLAFAIQDQIPTAWLVDLSQISWTPANR